MVSKGATLSVRTLPYNCATNRNKKKMKKIKKVGINLFRDLKKPGVKEQYVQYIKNRVRQFFGYKTFVLHNSNNICTSDETISVGREYQYREGSILERAIIERIAFSEFFIELKVFLIEQNRHINCSQTLMPCGYSGMWRIYDSGHYNIEEWRRERDEMDFSGLDNIPVITL